MKQLILLLAFSSVFLNCRKEHKPPEKPYIEIPKDVWAYIKLTPGSWYIYKDSATGLTDSVIVTMSTMNFKVPQYGNIFGNSYLDHYNDDFRVILQKVDPSENKTVWLDASSRSVIYFGSNIDSYWILEDLFKGITLMQYPSKTPFSTSQIHKIQNISIEGNTYTDVQVIGRDAAAIWWARGVGIVKMTYLKDNEIKTTLLLRKK
jgi:hypothetical protein